MRRRGDPERAAPARFGGGVTGLPRWVRVLLTVPLALASVYVVGSIVALLADRPADRAPGDGMWAALFSVPLAYLLVYGPGWVRALWRPTEESHRHDLAVRAEQRRIAEAFEAERREPPPRPQGPRRW